MATECRFYHDATPETNKLLHVGIKYSKEEKQYMYLLFSE